MWSSTEEARTQTTRTTAARGCGVPAGTKPLLKWRERATPRKKAVPGGLRPTAGGITITQRTQRLLLGSMASA